MAVQGRRLDFSRLATNTINEKFDRLFTSNITENSRHSPPTYFNLSGI